MTLECLPNSTLPEELRKLGYLLVDTGEECERILACAIEEKLVTGDDGALQPLTEGSTRPIAMTVRHAGIVKTRRYAFTMP